MLLVDFALDVPGTTMPADFVTPEGLHVVLPGPSVIGSFGGRTGLAVHRSALLEPPIPLDEVTIRMAAGAAVPLVRLIDPAGNLLGSFQTNKSANHIVVFNSPQLRKIGHVEIDFPNGEGGLLALAGCGDAGLVMAAKALREIDAFAMDPTVCQAIVYGETGTMETKPEGLTGLAEARQFIAAVAYARNGAGVAKPKYPTADELKQPFIKRAWDRCGVAAKDAQGHDVGKCKHFVIWYSDDEGKTPSRTPSSIKDEWPYTETAKIAGHWGPYTVNELNGDNIYVIKYCGVT